MQGYHNDYGEWSQKKGLVSIIQQERKIKWKQGDNNKTRDYYNTNLAYTIQHKIYNKKHTTWK